MEKWKKRKDQIRGKEGDERRRWRERETARRRRVKERLLIMLTTRPKLTALPNTHTHRQRVTERQAYMNTHTHTGSHRHSPLTRLLQILFTTLHSNLHIKSIKIEILICLNLMLFLASDCMFSTKSADIHISLSQEAWTEQFLLKQAGRTLKYTKDYMHVFIMRRNSGFSNILPNILTQVLTG